MPSPKSKARKARRALQRTACGPFEIMGSGLVIQAADSTEDSAERTVGSFSGTVYSGGRLYLATHAFPVVIDLSGLAVPRRSSPILREHDPLRIVGYSTEVESTGGSIRMSGKLAESNDGFEVAALARSGFQWQTSVGVRATRMEFVPRGSRVTVNNRTFVGPIYCARESRLQEVSFVAYGADLNNSVRVAATAFDGEGSMPFEQWLQARGFNLNELSDDQEKFLRQQYQAEIAASGAGGGDALGSAQDDDDASDDEDVRASGETGTGTPAAGRSGRAGASTPPSVRVVDGGATPSPADDIRASAAAEYQRIRAIEQATTDTEIRATAIAEGWDATRTELEVLRRHRPHPPAGGGQGDSRDNHLHARAVEAAICASAGMSRESLVAAYGEQVMERAESRELRGSGLVRVMHETLRAAGISARTDRITNEVIEATFRADQQLRAAGGGGGFSTVSLSGILSNVANKLMLSAYNAVSAVAPQICQETDTNDFKEFKSYRLLGSGRLEQLGPDGEIKHTTLTEQEFSNQVLTYARMIALTRTMMVNDDLSAFSELPRLFGRMANITRERAVFELLLSNPSSFFSAGNGNYIDGAGTTLQISQLTVLEQKFLDQTDPAGDPIMVDPKILLVPTALKVTAQEIYEAVKVNETTTANKKSPDNNPHAGKFRPVASPYLNSQSLTGSSATGWYLFAEPSELAAMQIAYLRGQRTPVIESAQTDFNTLGMQWRTVYDFGVAMQDYRGAAFSKGAA